MVVVKDTSDDDVLAETDVDDDPFLPLAKKETNGLISSVKDAQSVNDTQLVKDTQSVKDTQLVKDTQSVKEMSVNLAPPIRLDTPIRLETQSSTGLMEFELDLADVPETDTFQLRNRKEVYYTMYREAKKKAKIARDLALSSYLEAKRIKNTYMLDDASESESDEEEEEDEEEEDPI